MCVCASWLCVFVHVCARACRRVYTVCTLSCPPTAVCGCSPPYVLRSAVQCAWCRQQTAGRGCRAGILTGTQASWQWGLPFRSPLPRAPAPVGAAGGGGGGGVGLNVTVSLSFCRPLTKLCLTRPPALGGMGLFRSAESTLLRDDIPARPRAGSAPRLPLQAEFTNCRKQFVGFQHEPEPVQAQSREQSHGAMIDRGRVRVPV